MESDFASVWSRVTGLRPTEDELTKLRRWMGDEAGELFAYEALLRGSLSASVRDTLKVLLRSKQRHLKELRTLYYLRTGDVRRLQGRTGQTKPPLMKALRDRYAASLALAEGYRSCNEDARDLRALCAILAEDEDLNALRLRRMIKSLL